LVTAALAWLAMVAFAASPTGAAAAAIGVALHRTAFAAMQWSAIVAAIGFATLHLNRDHAWRRYLTDAVFPVYIVHQSLIVGFAVAASALSLRPWVEAPLLVIATFACSFAAYEGVRRVGWLRPWFGLQPRSTTAAAPVARLDAAANAR
jgi:surface polysaccharide O-acyltransferase-like enzyme